MTARPHRRRLALAGAALLLALGAAAPGCEAGFDLFYACAEDGRCDDGLQCYRAEGVTGYCTASCYGSLECPKESVCFEGACVLACVDGGDPCPGGTTCNLVEPPRGICQP